MNHEGLNREIMKAATAVALEWPGVIEADDVQQEIWVKLLESRNYVEQIINMEPAQRAESLKRIGHQIAARYRNDYELFTGNWYYGADHVRSLLDEGILTIAYEDFTPGAETLTDYMDAHGGYAALRERNEMQAQIIWSAYVTEEYDSSSTSQRRLLSRAIRALTELMNQTHRRRFAEYEEGPGTRKVISNEKARVISQRQYSGRGNGYNSFAQ